MHVWLTHIGETLPIDGPVRLFRYGLLADELIRRGHRVTRWAPTFVHATKRFRAGRDTTITLNDNYTIELLHAGGYARHVGLRRLVFTKRLAKAFDKKLASSKPPDIILAGLPTPEICDHAVRFAQRHGIPVVVDIRDLWPHIFVDAVPKPLKPLARYAVRPLLEKVKRALREASAIYAVSSEYLQWGLALAGRNARATDKVHFLGRPRSQPGCQTRNEAENFCKSRGFTATRGFRCCYIGSMNHTSDLFTVIQAARMLRSAVREIEFVICGEGPKLKALQDAASDLPNVRFVGWVNQGEMSVLMEWSDVGLAAYAAGAPQSVPNKPIEYLSASLPIVSSLQGELAWLIDHYRCGRQYKAGDAVELARILNEMSTANDETASMRTNADRLFQRHFDASRVYGQMIDDLVELRAASYPMAA